MIDSIAPGDTVMVIAKVIGIMDDQVVIDIEGGQVMVRPSLLRRPFGGAFADSGTRRRGMEARAAGKSIAACPYTDDPRSARFKNAWIKGWMEGEK